MVTQEPVPPGVPRPAWLGRWLLGVALAVVPFPVLPGQAPGEWRVVTADGAAALLGALRQLELPDVGPFPLYAPRAPGGAVPQALTLLRRAPQFEVLHFAPLYAAGLSRDQVVLALRAAGRPATAPPGSLLEASLRATLADSDRTAVLPALAGFVDARAASPGATDAEYLEVAWRQRYAPRLRPFLESERLSGGRVIVSPHLGAEGRIFAGRAEDPTDNVIAVGAWPGAGREAPLLAMLRELCYPAVTRSLRVTAGEDREASTRRAAFAAVRCGAFLADRVSVAAGADYRAIWAAVGPRPAAPFDLQYARDAVLGPAIERLLAAAFRTTAP